MIIWGFTILALILGLSVSVYGIKNDFDDLDKIVILVLGPTLFIVSIIIPIGVYYDDTIAIPESYRAINNKIEQVKNIRTNTFLNMADTNINQTLAELIKEKEDIILRVRINNRSPFAYFKINLID